MKKQIVIVLTVMMIGGFLTSQAQSRFDGPRGQHFEMMAEELDLTDTQKESLKLLHESLRAEMKSTFEALKEQDLDREEMRAAMKKVHENHFEKVKEVLTPEQIEILEKKRENFDPENRFSHQRKGMNMDAGFKKGNKHSYEFMNQLIEKRIAFDNELSNNEIEIIETFRAEMKERQPKRDYSKKDGKGQRPQGMNRGMNRGMRGQKAQMEPIYTIAENHKESISSLLEDIDHPISPVRFVLMDTDKMKEQLTIVATQSESSLSVYPNPAQSIINLSYTLSADTKVKIELLDKNGNKIKEVMKKKMEAGEHTKSIDIANLPDNDIYIIRVTQSSGTETVKFVISRL